MKALQLCKVILAMHLSCVSFLVHAVTVSSSSDLKNLKKLDSKLAANLAAIDSAFVNASKALRSCPARYEELTQAHLDTKAQIIRASMSLSSKISGSGAAKNILSQSSRTLAPSLYAAERIQMIGFTNPANLSEIVVNVKGQGKTSLMLNSQTPIKWKINVESSVNLVRVYVLGNLNEVSGIDSAKVINQRYAFATPDKARAQVLIDRLMLVHIKAYQSCQNYKLQSFIGGTYADPAYDIILTNDSAISAVGSISAPVTSGQVLPTPVVTPVNPVVIPVVLPPVSNTVNVDPTFTQAQSNCKVSLWSGASAWTKVSSRAECNHYFDIVQLYNGRMTVTDFAYEGVKIPAAQWPAERSSDPLPGSNKWCKVAYVGGGTTATLVADQLTCYEYFFALVRNNGYERLGAMTLDGAALVRPAQRMGL